ncbi:MAG: hypothetical protein ACRELA_18325 [Candidatus Rokuibacteriota bacterium]
MDHADFPDLAGDLDLEMRAILERAAATWQPGVVQGCRKCREHTWVDRDQLCNACWEEKVWATANRRVCAVIHGGGAGD